MLGHMRLLEADHVGLGSLDVFDDGVPAIRKDGISSAESVDVEGKHFERVARGG